MPKNGKLTANSGANKPHSKQLCNYKQRLSRKQMDALDKEALELAELIYDMYQDDLASGKILNGQNNAQSPNS